MALFGCLVGAGTVAILWQVDTTKHEPLSVEQCRRETSELIRDLFWHSDDVRALHISEWAWGDLRPWQAGAFLGCRVVERGRCSFKDFGLCYRCRKILLPRFME